MTVVDRDEHTGHGTAAEPAAACLTHGPAHDRAHARADDRANDRANDQPDDRADRLSAAFSRMFRFNVRMRAEMTAVEFDGRELATLVVLHRLADDGAMRAGALADRLHMDPSQVSRAVTALVREQAVQRLADPDDGRATLLVPTDTGRELARRFARAKSAHVGSVISDWEPGEAEAFTAGLERFVDGLERVVPPRPGQTPTAHTAPPQTSPAPPGPDGDDAPDTTPAEPGATT